MTSSNPILCLVPTLSINSQFILIKLYHVKDVVVVVISSDKYSDSIMTFECV